MRLKKNSIYIALSLLTFSAASFADESSTPLTNDANSAFESKLDKGSFFGGLGGGSNSVQVSQQLSATTSSGVYNSNSVLVASGEVSGDAASYDNTQSAFSPEIQLGYVKHFSGNDWLWGGKFFYQYVGVTSTDENVDIPTEKLTPVSVGLNNSGPYSFENNSFTSQTNIGSAQTVLNHQIVLMPFVGKSFENGYVYFGVGPALFGTESKINGVTSSVDVDGIYHSDTGTSSDLSSSQWVWGGAAQIGMTYYLDSSWFLDINYTYAISQNYSVNYTTQYSSTTDIVAPAGGAPSTSASSSYTDKGTVNINTSQQITNQSFAITINKMFW